MPSNLASTSVVTSPRSKGGKPLKLALFLERDPDFGDRGRQPVPRLIGVVQDHAPLRMRDRESSRDARLAPEVALGEVIPPVAIIALEAHLRHELRHGRETLTSRMLLEPENHAAPL